MGNTPSTCPCTTSKSGRSSRPEQVELIRVVRAPLQVPVSIARLTVLAGALWACSGTAWAEGPALIDSLLQVNPVCAPVLAEAERHELQILYTQIDRDAVSDNDAYNRIYEFVGQQRMNEGLWEKGYKDVRLTHRLAVPRSSTQNRHTNPFTIYRGDQVLHRQPMLANPHSYRAPEPIPKGKGHIQGGELVEAPKDFAGSNYMPVEVLQDLLLAALFPETLPKERRFDLEAGDYAFLHRAMSMLPRECPIPHTIRRPGTTAT